MGARSSPLQNGEGEASDQDKWVHMILTELFALERAGELKGNVKQLRFYRAVVVMLNGEQGKQVRRLVEGISAMGHPTNASVAVFVAYQLLYYGDISVIEMFRLWRRALRNT